MCYTLSVSDMSTGFYFAVAAVSTAAGAVASVAGFGIGSLLTPLLAAALGTKLAVAAVSIPHLIGTTLRFAMVREHIDRGVFVRFGLTSAVGGLVGALLNARFGAVGLTVAFGAVLCLAGLMELSGLARRLRFGRKTAVAAGAASGLLGGLVGNQGGIRTAALLGFAVSKESFVATSTAAGIIVDGARMPVYLWTEGGELARRWPVISTAAAGVVLGTFAGQQILGRIPEPIFKRIVALLVLALGVSMFVKGGMMQAEDVRGARDQVEDVLRASANSG